MRVVAFHQGINKCSCVEMAACCHIYVLFHIFCQWLFVSSSGFMVIQTVLKTGKPKGKSLSQMAQNQLRCGQFVKDTAA